MKKNALYLFTVLLIFIGCKDDVSREEIIRIRSPDSIVDALLIRTNAGATTSYGYVLYIVPSGENMIKGNELLRADNVKNFNICWIQPKILEIHYEKARIFFFSNFWHSKDVQNFQYIVELRLVFKSQFFL